MGRDCRATIARGERDHPRLREKKYSSNTILSRKSEFDKQRGVVAVKMTVKRTSSPKQHDRNGKKTKLALDAPRSGIERVPGDRNTPQASFNNNVRDLLSSVKASLFAAGLFFHKRAMSGTPLLCTEVSRPAMARF